MDHAVSLNTQIFNRPQASDVIEVIKPKLAAFGVTGFWYQGVAKCAHENYINPCRSKLFSPSRLRSSHGILSSSPQLQQLLQYYLNRHASDDPNYPQVLKLDQAWRYQMDDAPARTQRLWSRHNIHQLLTVTAEPLQNSPWLGRFTLVSEQPLHPEMLHDTLVQCQLQLSRLGRDRFNPYRHSAQLNATALQVLQLTAEGQHNHQIADSLRISTRGVEYHLEILREKLTAANRAHLIHVAHQLEII